MPNIYVVLRVFIQCTMTCLMNKFYSSLSFVLSLAVFCQGCVFHAIDALFCSLTQLTVNVLKFRTLKKKLLFPLFVILEIMFQKKVLVFVI